MGCVKLGVCLLSRSGPPRKHGINSCGADSMSSTVFLSVIFSSQFIIVMSSDGPYPPLPDPSTLPHDSLVPNIVVCAVVTWAIAAVFVALRFYTRTCILSVIGWSDWLILTSWIFSCGVTASAIEQSQRGIGKHVYDYDWMANLTPFQKVSSLFHPWLNCVRIN